MRYIKFRALRKTNPKTIELVRVTDTGKIVPKGYGPLLLEVLDNDIKTMGTSLKPSNILCFGATGSIDDIRITGTVDVYIDGHDEPILTNVTEEQISQMSKDSFQDILQPYTPAVVEPTEDFHFLTLDKPSRTGYVYKAMSLTVGIKLVGEDIRWSANGGFSYDPSNGIMTNPIGYESFEDLSQFLSEWLEIESGYPIGVNLTHTPVVPSVELFARFKHSQFMETFYSPVLYSNAEEPAYNEDGQPVSFSAVDLSLTLPPEVEYIVIPTLVTPYGQSSEYFNVHVNNTMIYDNIVYYADGRIETNVTSVPQLPDANLYTQGEVFLLDYPEYTDTEVITVDISEVPVQMDQHSLSSGRYIDIRAPAQYMRSMTLAYNTTETLFETQGVHWVDYALGGRQTFGGIVGLKRDGAIHDTWFDILSVTPELTKLYIEPDIRRVYRFKLPADVLSIDICFYSS